MSDELDCFKAYLSAYYAPFILESFTHDGFVELRLGAELRGTDLENVTTLYRTLNPKYARLFADTGCAKCSEGLMLIMHVDQNALKLTVEEGQRLLDAKGGAT